MRVTRRSLPPPIAGVRWHSAHDRLLNTGPSPLSTVSTLLELHSSGLEEHALRNGQEGERLTEGDRRRRPGPGPHGADALRQRCRGEKNAQNADGEGALHLETDLRMMINIREFDN